jgi:transcriptional regulator with XRE-family HTH domain
MPTWHDRLNRLMRDKGWSARELARRADVPYDRLAKYLQGRVAKPRGEVIGKLAAALGTTELFITYGLDVGQIGNNTDSTKRRVPIVTLAAVALRGLEGAMRDAEIAGSYAPALSDDMRDCCVVAITDRANAPVLSPGDNVYCCPGMAPMPGCFVLAAIDGLAVIRRYRELEIVKGRRAIQLVAENPDFPAINVQVNHTSPILAVVTHHVRPLL